MFEGFEERLIETLEADIFCRIGGSGPPLLLIHGYPQTSAMWHRVAPDFARDHTVVCPDLRGYGRSSKPESTADHAAYSKRAMASDLVSVMRTLGHDAFYVVGHDRGARVAHRMALDHPAAVHAVTVLDIAPTREMYRDADTGFATDYWHWYFLIQPAPFPETLIGAAPEAYLMEKMGGGSAGLAPFSEAAMAEYRSCFCDPATIHASCEDYRAAASIDIAHDDADGTRKVEAPLMAIWGAHGVIARRFDCLALWRERAERVEGHDLPGGHYLAEELPERVVSDVRTFIDRHTI